MFPGVQGAVRGDFTAIDKARVDVEMAAHGVSMVEIERQGETWKVVEAGPRNRRITAATAMTADGPAAGLDIRDTLNNCGGGHTPWGTYLTAEENFNGYFYTDQKGADSRRLNKGLGGDRRRQLERYGIPSNGYNWGQFHDRFNVDKEPNEANRFGWIVEIDPTDPASKPVKHTALGRFRHEAAETHVNKDGRVVIYSGDDSTFEYVYRYVSKGRFVPGDKAANSKLLAEGALSVARFDADGTVTWLPMEHGQGPLTAANGFASQADVLIDARIAGDLLKATPMDRPEDVQVSPRNGRVYVLQTNNSGRKPEQVDKANPRAANLFGHII
jgi:secreted PhoX family phosphatase